MSNPQFSISGGVVFWSLGGGTDWQTMFDGLTAAGFQKECADRVTIPEALKSALLDLFGQKRVLVRPLPAGNGYAVVDESASSSKTLEYNARVVCKWPLAVRNVSAQDIVVEQGTTEDRLRIYDAVQGQLDIAPHNKVAASLVAIVGKLGGVPLKPNGGIYWIPERAMSSWASAVSVIERSGAGNQVFTARTAMDDDAIRAVVSAVRTEIGTEIAALAEQALTGGDGKRSMSSRQAKAERLLARVTDYEQLLGVTLQELKDGIETATACVVSIAAASMGEDMADMFADMSIE